MTWFSRTSTVRAWTALTFTRWVCRLGGPPVIVLTGYYHPLCRKQAFASGAMACLAKPVRLPLLAEVIELVVDRGVRFIGTGREKKQRIFFPEKNEKIQR
jgi:CheY-like chemotaxis protein